jgi:hypothetical protein
MKNEEERLRGKNSTLVQEGAHASQKLSKAALYYNCKRSSVNKGAKRKDGQLRIQKPPRTQNKNSNENSATEKEDVYCSYIVQRSTQGH